MSEPSVSGYKILAKIKDGGTYGVYRAENAKGEVVALKMLLPKFLNDKEALGMVKREAKLAIPLSHPNVIKTHALVLKGTPRPALEMEYFAGETLKLFIKSKFDEIDLAARLRLMNACCDGLQYLHQQSIVHKDIKPENIMVDAGFKELRIIDLSLAQTLSEIKWEDLNPFKKRKVQGTVTYISPEMIRKKRLDPRTDVYSMGVVFFELCVGQPPFAGKSQNDLIQAHLNQAPPSIRVQNKAYPQELDRIIGQMLAKDPGGRISDMGTVKVRLQQMAKRLNLKDSARL